MSIKTKFYEWVMPTDNDYLSDSPIIMKEFAEGVEKSLREFDEGPSGILDKITLLKNYAKNWKQDSVEPFLLDVKIDVFRDGSTLIDIPQKLPKIQERDFVVMVIGDFKDGPQKVEWVFKQGDREVTGSGPDFITDLGVFDNGNVELRVTVKDDNDAKRVFTTSIELSSEPEITFDPTFITPTRYGQTAKLDLKIKTDYDYKVIMQEIGGEYATPIYVDKIVKKEDGLFYVTFLETYIPDNGLGANHLELKIQIISSGINEVIIPITLSGASKILEPVTHITTFDKKIDGFDGNMVTTDKYVFDLDYTNTVTTSFHTTPNISNDARFILDDNSKLYVKGMWLGKDYVEYHYTSINGVSTLKGNQFLRNNEIYEITDIGIFSVAKGVDKLLDINVYTKGGHTFIDGEEYAYEAIKYKKIVNNIDGIEYKCELIQTIYGLYAKGQDYYGGFGLGAEELVDTIPNILDSFTQIYPDVDDFDCDEKNLAVVINGELFLCGENNQKFKEFVLDDTIKHWDKVLIDTGVSEVKVTKDLLYKKGDIYYVSGETILGISGTRSSVDGITYSSNPLIISVDYLLDFSTKISYVYDSKIFKENVEIEILFHFEEETFTKVLTAKYHSVAISNGILYIVGQRNHGFGNQEYRTWKNTGIEVDDVECGLETTFIKIKGEWFGAGKNDSKQLGLKEEYVPQFKKLGLRADKIVASSKFTCALKNGFLYFVGNLPNSPYIQKDTWFKTDKEVDDVACGNSNIYITKDKSLFACGDNNFGQLANGTNTPSINFIQVPGLVIDSFIEADKIYAGFDNLVVESNSSMYICGSNVIGQLGLSNYNNNINVLTLINYVGEVFIGPLNVVIKTDTITVGAGDNKLMGNGLGNTNLFTEINNSFSDISFSETNSLCVIDNTLRLNTKGLDYYAGGSVQSITFDYVYISDVERYPTGYVRADVSDLMIAKDFNGVYKAAGNMSSFGLGEKWALTDINLSGVSDYDLGDKNLAIVNNEVVRELGNNMLGDYSEFITTDPILFYVWTFGTNYYKEMRLYKVSGPDKDNLTFDQKYYYRYGYGYVTQTDVTTSPPAGYSPLDKYSGTDFDGVSDTFLYADRDLTGIIKQIKNDVTGSKTRSYYANGKRYDFKPKSNLAPLLEQGSFSIYSNRPFMIGQNLIKIQGDCVIDNNNTLRKIGSENLIAQYVDSFYTDSETVAYIKNGALKVYIVNDTLVSKIINKYRHLFEDKYIYDVMFNEEYVVVMTDNVYEFKISEAIDNDVYETKDGSLISSLQGFVNKAPMYMYNYKILYDALADKTLKHIKSYKGSTVGISKANHLLMDGKNRGGLFGLENNSDLDVWTQHPSEQPYPKSINLFSSTYRYGNFKNILPTPKDIKCTDIGYSVMLTTENDLYISGKNEIAIDSVYYNNLYSTKWSKINNIPEGYIKDYGVSENIGSINGVKDYFNLWVNIDDIIYIYGETFYSAENTTYPNWRRLRHESLKPTKVKFTTKNAGVLYEDKKLYISVVRDESTRINCFGMGNALGSFERPDYDNYEHGEIMVIIDDVIDFDINSESIIVKTTDKIFAGIGDINSNEFFKFQERNNPFTEVNTVAVGYRNFWVVTDTQTHIIGIEGISTGSTGTSENWRYVGDYTPKQILSDQYKTMFVYNDKTLGIGDKAAIASKGKVVKAGVYTTFFESIHQGKLSIYGKSVMSVKDGIMMRSGIDRNNYMSGTGQKIFTSDTRADCGEILKGNQFGDNIQVGLESDKDIVYFSNYENNIRIISVGYGDEQSKQYFIEDTNSVSYAEYGSKKFNRDLYFYAKTEDNFYKWYYQTPDIQFVDALRYQPTDYFNKDYLVFSPVEYFEKSISGLNQPIFNCYDSNYKSFVKYLSKNYMRDFKSANINQSLSGKIVDIGDDLVFVNYIWSESEGVKLNLIKFKAERDLRKMYIKTIYHDKNAKAGSFKYEYSNEVLNIIINEPTKNFYIRYDFESDKTYIIENITENVGDLGINKFSYSTASNKTFRIDNFGTNFKMYNMENSLNSITSNKEYIPGDFIKYDLISEGGVLVDSKGFERLVNVDKSYSKNKICNIKSEDIDVISYQK